MPVTGIDDMDDDITQPEKLCPECNTGFSCGPAAGKAFCWCNSYPAIIAIEDGESCRCPDCLATLVSDRINKQLDTITHEAALALASAYSGHKLLVEKIDYYIEAGKLVFTRWYHLKRGSCCGNDCRHCPY